MFRTSLIATALVALVGMNVAAPAMANDVRIEQYGWGNSAGGAQQGYWNRIRTYQNGDYNRLVAASMVATICRPSGRKAMTTMALPIRTAIATQPASASSAPITRPS